MNKLEAKEYKELEEETKISVILPKDLTFQLGNIRWDVNDLQKILDGINEREPTELESLEILKHIRRINEFKFFQ